MMNFPLNLTAAGMQPVSQVGNYVYYKAGSAGGADPSIKVKTDLGDEYILMPGQGFRLDNRVFNNLQVTNAGGQATILGVLLIADGGFFDNRVTGSVEVIDGGKNRTLAGTAFAAYAYSGAVSAKNSGVQIFNPAGSGKRVVISSMSLTPDQDTVLNFVIGQTALATAGALGVAKMANNATPSVARSRVDNFVGAISGVVIGVIGAKAFATYEKKFGEPIILSPGYGLGCYANALNSALGSMFEYFEETDA